MASRLSPSQIAEAQQICAEFGPRYAGIQDRLDEVVLRLNRPSLYSDAEVAEAVEELLSSVSPAIRTRILAA